jgi:hypothetical protein
MALTFFYYPTFTPYVTYIEVTQQAHRDPRYVHNLAQSELHATVQGLISLGFLFL